MSCCCPGRLQWQLLSIVHRHQATTSSPHQQTHLAQARSAPFPNNSLSSPSPSPQHKTTQTRPLSRLTVPFHAKYRKTHARHIGRLPRQRRVLCKYCPELYSTGMVFSGVFAIPARAMLWWAGMVGGRDTTGRDRHCMDVNTKDCGCEHDTLWLLSARHEQNSFLVAHRRVNTISSLSKSFPHHDVYHYRRCKDHRSLTRQHVRLSLIVPPKP
jgi:hypothetical protein